MIFETTLNQRARDSNLVGAMALLQGQSRFENWRFELHDQATHG